MPYIKYAIEEFKRAGFINEDGTYCDEMQELMCKQVLQTLKLIGEQGHSGVSFDYFIQMLTRLANFKPLTPLTGKDDEWVDVNGRGVYQNRRCSSVFKDNEKVYDIDGYVFRQPNGVCYTKGGGGSRKYITFPYEVPDKPTYIDVDKNDNIVVKAKELSESVKYFIEEIKNIATEFEEYADRISSQNRKIFQQWFNISRGERTDDKIDQLLKDVNEFTGNLMESRSDLNGTLNKLEDILKIDTK